MDCILYLHGGGGRWVVDNDENAGTGAGSSDIIVNASMLGCQQISSSWTHFRTRFIGGLCEDLIHETSF